MSDALLMVCQSGLGNISMKFKLLNTETLPHIGPLIHSGKAVIMIIMRTRELRENVSF